MSKDSSSEIQENASHLDGKSAIEDFAQQGQRAFALKQYEQAVEHYAKGLELSAEKYGERALESADLLLQYGRALLENAISQSAVLAQEQDEDKEEVTKDPRFIFEGDEAQDNDEAIHLSSLPDDDEDSPDEAEAEGEDEDAPEDDFNAAWEVLELARVLYDQRKDEDDEIKLKLADVYLALGDVSLETEKFDQAISDYTSAVSLKTELLPFSSRQIAEGHLKLALVLDITSGRLADAIRHVESSIESVEARLSELRNGSQSQAIPPLREAASNQNDVKGKGKAKKLVRDPLVGEMSAEQIENEVKDLEGMKQELQLKLEEIRTAPDDSEAATPAATASIGTAPELAALALDKDLNSSALMAAAKVALNSSSVNDLTSAVRKRKKKAEPEVDTVQSSSTSNGIKRKAEEEGATSKEFGDKRAKISEEVNSPSL